MLFVWKSNYLKGYRRGVIAIEAETLSSAVAIATAKFDRHVAEQYYCGHLDEDGDIVLDDYDREDYDRYKARFLDDLAQPPEILEGDGILVYGGD